jgi:hypothetical protein
VEQDVDSTSEVYMDKFAVSERQDVAALEKAASHGCPLCGAKVEQHGNVVLCPRHGSEPFERKRQDE